MPKLPSGVKIPELPHQDFAIDQILGSESLLVEYGTGTGKTMIIARTCKALVRAGDVPIVVVMPNSLLEQTYQQFQFWCGRKWTRNNVIKLDRAYTVYQRRQELKRGAENIYLISHESLSRPEIREGLYSKQWAAAIIDEASRFRNFSKRTTTLKTLGSRARTRYAFTGNLMVRVPTDVFYVMDFLRPNVFETRDRQHFTNMYCMLGGYMGNVAVDVRPDKIADLKDILDANRIRCELRDIRELPRRELIVRVVDLSPKQLKVYKQMRDELMVEIERTSEPEFRSEVKTYGARLQRLQEIAAGFARNIDGDVEFLPSPKTTETADIIEDDPSVPTIIWYWWIPERDRLVTELKRRKIKFSLFGDPNAQADFQAGKTNVFLSQLAKGGYGLNLPRAIRMIYHSLPWDLDVYSQSQERNVRLDTTAEYLEVIHMVAYKTADEYVRDKLLAKADMSSVFSKSQALELLKGLK